MKRLVSLGEALNRPSSVAGVAAAIGRAALGLIDAQRVAVYLRSPGGVATCPWSQALSPEYVTQVVTPAGANPWAHLARHPELTCMDLPKGRRGHGVDPTLLPNVGELPQGNEVRRLAEEEGFKALSSWPLVRAGRVIASVSCYYDARHAWSPPEREVMLVFASQAAAALESALLTEARRQRTAESETEPGRSPAAHKQPEAESARLPEIRRELEAESARLSEAQMQLQDENARLHETQQRLEVENIRLREIQRQLETEVARLPEAMKHRTGELEAENARLVEVQQQIEAERDRLAATQTKLQAEIAQLSDAQQRVEAENTRLAAVHAEVQEENARLSGTEKQLAMENARLSEAQMQLRSENARLHEAQAETQRRLEAENVRLTGVQKQLEAQNARLSEAHTLLEAEHARLLETQRRLEAENARLSEIERQSEGENARLTEANRRLEAESAQPSDAERRLHEENARLQAIHRTLEAENARLSETQRTQEARTPRPPDGRKPVDAESAPASDMPTPRQVEGVRPSEAHRQPKVESDTPSVTPKPRKPEGVRGDGQKAPAVERPRPPEPQRPRKAERQDEKTRPSEAQRQLAAELDAVSGAYDGSTGAHTPEEIQQTLVDRVVGVLHADHGGLTKLSPDEFALTLGRTLDARDANGVGHSERLARWVAVVAGMLGCREEEIRDARWGALLHDIGKLGVPEATLRKPAGLTDEERAVLRQEPVVAEKILKSVKGMQGAANVLRNHCEKWDGTGYPGQLKEDAIPLGARILAVVEAYSEMTTERPGRLTRYHLDAVAEIKRGAGAQFDPHVVDAFCRALLRERDQPDSVAAAAPGGIAPVPGSVKPARSARPA